MRIRGQMSDSSTFHPNLKIDLGCRKHIEEIYMFCIDIVRFAPPIIFVRTLTGINLFCIIKIGLVLTIPYQNSMTSVFP